MNAIRFSKLKSATIVELVAMIGVDTNPNSKVYISTERPARKASEYTINELETLLIIAKQAKLEQEAMMLEESNPDLFDYIKKIGVIENYPTNDEDEYNDAY
jgi:hypothetical protein